MLRYIRIGLFFYDILLDRLSMNNYVLRVSARNEFKISI